MSRRAARPLRLGSLAAAAALMLVVSGAGPLAAQGPPERAGLALTVPVHEALVLLQDLWTEWHQGFREADADRTAESLADLLATMGQLGVDGVVDLSTAASALAVEAARQGDFERAGWALEAAEFLDPERPETLFASAQVEWLRGAYLRAPVLHAEGVLRLFKHSWERRLWIQSLILWGVYVLLALSVLFIGLQIAVKGRFIYRSFQEPLSHWVPKWLAHVLAVILLVWPLALPVGLLWLLLYVSALTWTHASRSERWVLLAVWFLVGAIPILANEQRRRIAVSLSPPVRAMHQLRDGRVSGAMLSELGALRRQLPNSVAVRQLLADVHRRLGQPDFSRALYLEVLDIEPQNASALVDLGAYYFRAGDPERAGQYFQTATTVAPDSVAGYFNLSLAYSASFRFDEADDVLRQAKQIDSPQVNAWIARSVSEWVVTFDGGISRIREIEQQLLGPRWEARPVSFVVSVLALLSALALQKLLRPERNDSRHLEQVDLIAIPGIESAKHGLGFRQVLDLIPLAVIGTLPFAERSGYPVPWGYEPPELLLAVVSAGALLCYVLVRIRHARVASQGA